MPDWKKLVRERISPIHLSHDTEGLIAELAAHLEETYDDARSRGMTEAAALKISLQEAGDWSVLKKAIRRTQSEENPMNHRTRSLWIPTLVSLFGASLSMAVLQWAGARPQLVWTGPVAMSFYWPWLCVLPFFGALGAYLSRRAGGGMTWRLLAALAPVLWLLVLSVVIEPIEMAVNGVSQIRYFGYGITNWVAIPGAALLMGAIPFLQKSAPAQTEV